MLTLSSADRTIFCTLSDSESRRSAETSFSRIYAMRENAASSTPKNSSPGVFPKRLSRPVSASTTERTFFAPLDRESKNAVPSDSVISALPAAAPPFHGIKCNLSLPAAFRAPLVGKPYSINFR